MRRAVRNSAAVRPVAALAIMKPEMTKKIVDAGEPDRDKARRQAQGSRDRERRWGSVHIDHHQGGDKSQCLDRPDHQTLTVS